MLWAVAVTDQSLVLLQMILNDLRLSNCLGVDSS